MTAEPQGCRWCDVPEREHMQRWKLPIGWHSWTAPSQEQIKDRMQQRRANNQKENLMTDTPTVADRLADTADGTWGEEAAVWLLAEHGHWLPELERCGLIDAVPWGSSDETATIVNWERVNVATSRLIGTQSEWRVLRIAGALGGAQSTQMHDLTSLDDTNRRLVLHAIAWAAGGQDWAGCLGLIPMPGDGPF